MPLVELEVQVPPLRQAGEQVALLVLEATTPAEGTALEGAEQTQMLIADCPIKQQSQLLGFPTQYD